MTKNQRMEIAKQVIMGKALKPEASRAELMLHFIGKEVQENKLRCNVNDLIAITGLVMELEKTAKVKVTTKEIGGKIATFAEIEQ